MLRNAMQAGGTQVSKLRYNSNHSAREQLHK